MSLGPECTGLSQPQGRRCIVVQVSDPLYSLLRHPEEEWPLLECPLHQAKHDCTRDSWKRLSFPFADHEDLSVDAFDVLALGIAYSVMLHAASNNLQDGVHAPVQMRDF